MTLITAQPRYNFASTGGHESDRDLMSYIRGVTGVGNASGDSNHIARPAKTTTGISAVFRNARQSVRIGVIFWIDGGGFASSDRKDVWFFSENPDQSLDDWLTIHDQGGCSALSNFMQKKPRALKYSIPKKPTWPSSDVV